MTSDDKIKVDVAPRVEAALGRQLFRILSLEAENDALRALLAEKTTAQGAHDEAKPTISPRDDRNAAVLANRGADDHTPPVDG